MRSLLTNLRRITTSAERERGRYADLVRLAHWFDNADDATAHALWASAFGLYSARHLGMLADDPELPTSPTTSWWSSPPADVPVMLRTQGARNVLGRTSAREDFTTTKAARLAERAATERRRAAAIAELTAHAGRVGHVRLSDDALEALLDVYAAALSADGHRAAIPGAAALLIVHATPGAGSIITSPSGTLTLRGTTLEVRAEGTGPDRAASQRVQGARG